MNLPNVIASLFHDVVFYLDKLSANQYAQPIAVLSEASVGQHTRHFIEFFQCLVAQAPTGTIDYDARVRNKCIEQDPTFVKTVIEDINRHIRTFDANTPLGLVADYSPEGYAPQMVETTFARELVYNIEHCVHHLAMIKIGLRVIAPNLDIPKGFGVAASTLRYWEAEAAPVKSA